MNIFWFVFLNFMINVFKFKSHKALFRFTNTKHLI